LNRRNDEIRRTLIERRKQEIALRVRPVCRHMPSDEFDELVERMATIEIKYAMRRDAVFADETRGWPDR
jgi:hypothetical protein